jgi:2-hydroxychromene-2-carboxylate isomerase
MACASRRGSAATRVAITEENAMPGLELLAEEESPAILADWAADDRDAVARGVFGGPTFFGHGERLYGQDRLDFLDRTLERTRA